MEWRIKEALRSNFKNRTRFCLLLLVAVASCTKAPTYEGKPTNGTEGIPGYFINADKVKATFEGGSVTLAAPAGSVIGKEGPSDKVVLSVWNTSIASLKAVAKNRGSRISIDGGKSLGIARAKADGSINIKLSLTKEYETTVIFVASDAEGKFIVSPSDPSEPTALFQFVPPQNGQADSSSVFALDGLAINSESSNGATAALPTTSQTIWITREEVLALPKTGDAWDQVKQGADAPSGSSSLADKSSTDNILVLAKAYAHVRLGLLPDSSYRASVIQSCMSLIGTDASSNPNIIGLKLPAYLVAAQLVGLPPSQDLLFRNWLRHLQAVSFSGLSLKAAHETWTTAIGTTAGAARAAIAAYLIDQVEIEQSAKIFKGFLGDRASYSGFTFSDLSWQASQTTPVGINPVGAEKSTHSIDGALPDSMGYGGTFRWPPPNNSQPWSTLEGALLQAETLRRAGFDTFGWESKALERAIVFLEDTLPWIPLANQNWLPWFANSSYPGTNGLGMDLVANPEPGLIMAWTNWTHAD